MERYHAVRDAMENDLSDPIPEKVPARAQGAGLLPTVELGPLRQKLLILASAIVGDAHRAEDLVQETFVQYFKGLQSRRPEGDHAHWLKGILKKLALHKARRFKVLPLDEELIRSVEANIEKWSEFAALGHTNLVDALLECVSKLDPESRRVLSMRYQENYSVQEIAQHLQRTISWVKVTLYRIRQSLKGCIESQEKINNGAPR